MLEAESRHRFVVEQLAPMARLPTSPGERHAANVVRDLLQGYGCRAIVQAVPAYRSYAWPIGVLSALGAASAVASLRGHRLAGAVGATVAAAGVIDDITGGAMLARRTVMRRATAYNVVAETGDRAASRTLVVLSHHDAAPSGVVFDQTIQQWLATHRPELLEAMKSNPPLWWPVIAAPALVGLGSVTGSRRLRWLGLLGCLGSLAAMVDIGRRPAVPGANDNLSGVAALLDVAAALGRKRLDGLRVLLVSAGAEEALQEGIRGFARTHFPTLPTASTYVINLDTVGSGRLVLLEGEGPLRMHDYDAAFKDRVAACAAQQNIALLRGLRSRNSTDGIVASRHGYPTATIVSVDAHKLVPHYHLDSDLPEHVDYRCVGDAARLTLAVARSLAG